MILLLLFIGSLCSLLPDSIVIYNMIKNGTMEHCWFGPIPTHSLLFSFSALILGVLVGYTAYRNFGKAIYMAFFAEAAFLSHLLLDDIGGGCEYFYPFYPEKISIFSMMDVSFRDGGLFHYLMNSFVSVFFVFFVLMLALFSLNHFGFVFERNSEKMIDKD